MDILTKLLLSKEQRAVGLRTHEDEHFLYLFDMIKPDKFIAVFSTSGATIEEIQRAAQEYLDGKEK